MMAKRTGWSHRLLLATGAVAFLLASIATAPSSVFGQTEPSPLKPLAQITIDDDGRELYYPSAIYFDPTEEEFYLVNGRSSRIVVYGPDFFPRVSIGVGRGVAAPRGAFVTREGEVYVCQGRNRNNPVPRITILNGAFFIEREILLDEIPEAEGLTPRQVAVSRDGLIYLVGESNRGVLVLDRDGTFLRLLQPMDSIFDKEAIAAAAKKREEEEKKRKEKEGALADAAEQETPARGRSRAEIPEEFRPRDKQKEDRGPSGPGLGPPRINAISIDSKGNLYLVSAETSRVYVYGPDERFLFSFGEKGGTPRKLSQPRGVAIDEERGLIYVADFMRHTILVYDLTGKFLFELGGRGTAPGWFNFPTDLAVNRQGHLLVADLFNHRVQVIEVLYDIAFPLFRQGRSAPPVPAENEASEEEVSPDADLSEGKIEEEVITEEAAGS